MKFNKPFQSATDRLLSEEAENSLYEKAANDIENENIEKKHCRRNYAWKLSFRYDSGRGSATRRNRNVKDTT